MNKILLAVTIVLSMLTYRCSDNYSKNYTQIKIKEMESAFLAYMNTIIRYFDGNNGVEDTKNWDKRIVNPKGINSINSIVIDSTSNVYVAGYGSELVSASSSYDWWIKKFSFDGTELDFGGSSAAPCGTGTSPCSTNTKDLVFDHNNGNDAILSMVLDHSGSIIVAGYGDNIVDDYSKTDWWIKKFSTSGVELDFGGASLVPCGSGTTPCSTNVKDRAYDGNSSIDIAKAVMTDSLGNIYIAGFGSRLINVSSSTDCWVKKFSMSGIEDTANWNKMYNGTTYDEVYSIAADASGSIIVAGYGHNLVSASSGNDWWIKKYNSGGDELNFGGDDTDPCGTGASPCTTNTLDMALDVNELQDRATAVAVDSANNVYVAGYVTTDSMTAIGTYWHVKKFSDTGVEDMKGWDKLLFYGYGMPCAVKTDAYDNVYLVGNGSNLITITSGSDWIIKKFNAQGHEDVYRWRKFYNFNGKDTAMAIAIGTYEVYVAGYGGVSGNGDDVCIKKFY